MECTQHVREITACLPNVIAGRTDFIDMKLCVKNVVYYWNVFHHEHECVCAHIYFRKPKPSITYQFNLIPLSNGTNRFFIIWLCRILSTMIEMPAYSIHNISNCIPIKRSNWNAMLKHSIKLVWWIQLHISHRTFVQVREKNSGGT